MNKNSPIYVHDKGRVYAFYEGRIIAESATFEAAEKTAVEYLDHLHKEREEDKKEKKREAATHITTPNGLKGKIMNRINGLWGEQELTVRLENGRIAKFIVKGDEEWTNERTASAESPLTVLRTELDDSYGHDKKSLAGRISKLKSIIHTASALVATNNKLSYDEQQEANKIVLEATAEGNEIKSALEYLEASDVEPFAPPKPVVVAQAAVGNTSGGSWLDKTAEAMTEEAESENYDQLLLEGPVELAAEMDTGTLDNPDSVAEMALSHVVSKTALFNEQDVVEYREKFVVATKLAAEKELAVRKAEETEKVTQKEASTKSSPDEALFW